jgi:hypothetical protein
MTRTTLTQLAFAISLTLATACGGAQKHAESPDFTEKGWSGPSSDGASAKADPPIQSASSAKTEEPKMAAADPMPASPPGPKPETSSAAEADIVSGSALPPPPKAPGASKPTKAKKPGKTKKKATRAARG